MLYALLAIALIGGLFMLAVRVLPAGEQIAPVVRDEPAWSPAPGRSMSPEDVDQIRLPVALRGYRFAETDALLDRLAEELRRRDQVIEQLRRGLPGTPAAGAVVDLEDSLEATTLTHLSAQEIDRPRFGPGNEPPTWPERPTAVTPATGDSDRVAITDELAVLDSLADEVALAEETAVAGVPSVPAARPTDDMATDAVPTVDAATDAVPVVAGPESVATDPALAADSSQDRRRGWLRRRAQSEEGRPEAADGADRGEDGQDDASWWQHPQARDPGVDDAPTTRIAVGQGRPTRHDARRDRSEGTDGPADRNRPRGSDLPPRG